MLFYPIEYFGTEIYREKDCPYGLFGWQGVVPARTSKMAGRLTEIVSTRLLSLKEAFFRIEPVPFAKLLAPTIEDAIRRKAPNGEVWARLMSPFLPFALKGVVRELQENIEEVLDLETVVMSAFVRDKRVLVDLFRQVGREELDFLIRSGSYFGFALGLVQMFAWAGLPRPWTLPVAGALVGYATNWVAIKLVFEPVEPVAVGPFAVQGLFGKRQAEVSDEFSAFLAARVLTSPRLIAELAGGKHRAGFERLLRRAVPWPVPDAVVAAAAEGLRELAANPAHPAHAYVDARLGLEATLAARLRALPAADFEQLLHPVFQEDEVILVAIGGVLGAAAGLAQLRLGWGGPVAAAAAAARAPRKAAVRWL